LVEQRIEAPCVGSSTLSSAIFLVILIVKKWTKLYKLIWRQFLVLVRDFPCEHLLYVKLKRKSYGSKTLSWTKAIWKNDYWSVAGLWWIIKTDV